MRFFGLAFRLTATLAILLVTCANAGAVVVTLTEATATATFSQGGPSPPYDFSVARSIDESYDTMNGWAIQPQIVNQTAAFETSTDTPAGPATLLTFTLSQFFDGGNGNTEHLLGNFRISATTADRSLFADGNDGKLTPGDVGDDSIWTQLTPITATAIFSTLSIQSGNTVFSSGPGTTTPAIDVYTITALAPFGSITGFRLEVIEEDSLPFDGPGRKPVNGNFVLTEFDVDAVAVPEVSAAMLFAGVGCVVGGGALIRRRRVA